MNAFDVHPGALFAGKYTLMSLLGVGGMGNVWSARNEATGAEVALKFLVYETPEEASESNARLRREARVTARLSHRGIVCVYDIVEQSEGGACTALVMELLRGRTLASLLDERVTLGVEETVGIALPLLSALAHAHAAGVIHRDLKPENIFLAVDPDGVVTPKLLDFGVSKTKVPSRRLPRPPTERTNASITTDGAMSGTPGYMSPEQVRGKHIDARSDVFNVGILIYELLSGRTPFEREGLQQTNAAILEESPRRIDDLPVALWDVIERALAKAPDARFESAAQLACALHAAVSLPSRASGAPPEPPVERVTVAPTPRRAPAPRRRWSLVAAGAGFAAGAGTALVTAVAAAALAPWTSEALRVARGHTEVTSVVVAQPPRPTIAPRPVDALKAPLATTPVDAIKAPLATIAPTPVYAALPPPASSAAPASTVGEPALESTAHAFMLVRDPGF